MSNGQPAIATIELTEFERSLLRNALENDLSNYMEAQKSDVPEVRGPYERLLEKLNNISF